LAASKGLSNNFKQKITVYIDFKTSFNGIQTYFEVSISNATRSIDIVQAIIKKLNNFIYKLNRMNKCSYLNLNEYYEDLVHDQNCPESFVVLKILPSSTFKFNTSCHILYKPLDANSNQYYLVVVLFDLSEMILIDNFLIANLDAPWSNGKFYLKEKKTI
jgi:hypothetical protein